MLKKGLGEAPAEVRNLVEKLRRSDLGEKQLFELEAMDFNLRLPTLSARRRTYYHALVLLAPEIDARLAARAARQREAATKKRKAEAEARANDEREAGGGDEDVWVASRLPLGKGAFHISYSKMSASARSDHCD